MYMLSVFLLVINSIIFVGLAKDINEEEDFGEVIFVNLCYRHGARTPEKTYKNDPYKDAFPDGLGELTNEGKNQQYELGKWLRQRYSTLLPERYTSDVIYVLASDKDRVLMSAQSNLAGMFPPKGDQVWNKELIWQPIPVHTVPQAQDKLIAEKASCPAYDQEFENVLKSNEVKDRSKKYDGIVKTLNENTGENRNDYKYIANMYDTLLVQSQMKLELPEWSKDIFPQPMEEATILKFTLATWNRKLARLKAGPLLQEMIKNMKDKIEQKSKRVFHVYSAHDSTIINLLNALDVFDSKMPPYAACVMMELRAKASGEHFVTLYYRPTASEEPRLLTVPGCDAACPLDTFITTTESVVPQDWDKECQVSN